MPEQETRSVYYEKPGMDNTDRTLELGRQRAVALGLKHAVVASTSGKTGVRACEVLQGLRVVVVTHSVGFAGSNQVELSEEHRRRIVELGGVVLTCQHAFGGIGRAVRRKLGTYQLDEVVAFVLRSFCEGIKVACEITVMATDAGLVPAGAEVLAIGGTGRGADTAVVILAANAQDFFDLRVLEIVCKPRGGAKTPTA